MRNILFRGRRKDNGEWIEGFYVCLFEKENGFYKAKHYIFDGNTKLGEEKYCGHGNYEQDVKTCKFEVIPETVGQFTGLTDKNGTKIFEGDIVNCFSSDIVGNPKISKILVKNMTDYNTMVYLNISNELEVIGNIHDNPKLLKGETE